MSVIFLALCLVMSVAHSTVADDFGPTYGVPEEPGFRCGVRITPRLQPEPASAEATGVCIVEACCCPREKEFDRDKNEDAGLVYVEKVMGITFANVRTSAVHHVPPLAGISPAWNSSTSNNGSLFTAAVAGGVRVPRDFGAIRLECEGALRDNFNQGLNPINQSSVSIRANDNWNVLANVWRDVPLTRRLGAYAGGGLGGGGYWLDATGLDSAVASKQSTVLAWQAGAGAMLRYNAFVDLDVSCRFLDFGHIDATLTQTGGGSAGTLTSHMAAGQLFFMLRVYEPFQWRKHLRSREFYLPD